VRFVAVAAVVFFFAYYAAGFLAQPLAWFAATASQALLAAMGAQTELNWVESVPHLANAALDAEIGELCWGRVELAVLLATIAASEDRSLRQRAAGVVLGVIAVIGVFNPLRIALSLRFLSEFVHDFLFRVTLLAVLVGFYAFWYLWLTRKVLIEGRRA